MLDFLIFSMLDFLIFSMLDFSLGLWILGFECMLVGLCLLCFMYMLVSIASALFYVYACM